MPAVAQWRRHRFWTDSDDERPVKMEGCGPWWCSGYRASTGEEYDQACIIAWLPADLPVTDFWPEAIDVDSDDAQPDISFNARFDRPDWWTDELAADPFVPYADR